MNVTARVSAVETRDNDLEIRQGGSRFGRETERGEGVLSAGTSDEDLAFVLAVEVDENLPAEEAFFYLKSTGHTCLFVDGDEAFDGAVLDVVGGQDGQRCSYADTVISTECSALGAQPLTVDNGLDRVVVEVVGDVVVLLANHIHVRLQDDGWQLLVALRCGF